MDKINLHNREDIRDFVVKIEQTFQINDWKVNDLHLWPILRIRLFFYLIDEIENLKKKNSDQTYHKPIKYPFLKSLKEKLVFNKWLYSLPKKKIIFVGTNAHRVNFDGKRFNRFFDSLISMNGQTEDYLYLEYVYDKNLNYYKKDKVFETENRIENFSRSRNYSLKYSLSNFHQFLNYLKSNPITEKFAEEISEEQLKQIGYKLYYRFEFYKKNLRKIQPQELYILCYYGGSTTYSIVAAANHLKIKTIEMQHGPQPDLHLCYTNWTNLPENGYDVLPRNFYQWDDGSVENINSWATYTKLYQPKKNGHPWIDFIKQVQIETPDDDFILYCLQPEPTSLEWLFNENIVNAIKNSNQKWYIRLHPRQIDRQEEIIQLLRKKELLHKINIEEATQLPLPALIKKSLVCVTHSSGVAIESELLNKKSVIIHELGVKYHQKTIERENAFYIDANSEDFPINFEIFINQLKDEKG